MTQPKRRRRDSAKPARPIEPPPIAEALGPILVLSALTLVLYSQAEEVLGTDRHFAWVQLNLALAWIPYALSSLVAIWARVQPKMVWLALPVAAVWVVYYPNAPYVVTDLIHIRQYAESVPWFDTLLASTVALTGVVIALASLRTFHVIVRNAWGRVAGIVFATSVICASAVGVYIGRFLRWNSWDVLEHTSEILQRVPAGEAASRPRLLLFASVFAVVQGCVYWAYSTRRGPRDYLT